MQEMLYNRKNNGGFLLHKIRNKENALKRKRKEGDGTPTAIDADMENETLSDKDKERLVELFKTCVVSRPQQKKRLKNALKKSIRFRDFLMADKKNEFADIFGFFFVAPDLVSCS